MRMTTLRVSSVRRAHVHNRAETRPDRGCDVGIHLNNGFAAALLVAPVYGVGFVPVHSHVYTNECICFSRNKITVESLRRLESRHTARVVRRESVR
jgi:hypothetical protein